MLLHFATFCEGDGLDTPHENRRRERARTNYLDCKLRSIIGTSRYVFNLAKSEHAVYNPAEDDVLPIEKVALCRGDEELTSVRVWPGIRLRRVEW